MSIMGNNCQHNWQNLYKNYCTLFTGLWDVGESVVKILSRYLLTKAPNATKMNSMCSYTYVHELLIVCRTEEELERLLIAINIRDFVI